MITKHAKIRMQQRSIHPLMLELLSKYGKEEVQNGATLRYFDRRGRKKAKRELSDLLQQLDSSATPYCVESEDSSIITAGRLFKRVRHR